MANQNYISVILTKLLNHLSVKKTSSQGFVLPLVIGLGVIMTVAGLTMVVRSNYQEIAAEQKEQNSQSSAAVEAGVAQVMEFLNRVRALSDNDIENWQPEFDNVVAACYDGNADDRLTDYIQGNWIEVNNNQRFRVVDYEYTASNPNDINSPGTGVLRVEGQANFDQNQSARSRSVIEVSIPNNPAPGEIPGLFTETAELDQNDVNGNVLMNNCNIPDSVDESNVEGTTSANPFASLPDLPELPENTANNDATVDATAEDLGAITNLNNTNGNDLNESDGNLVLPNEANNPDDDDDGNPDNQDQNGRFYYIVDDIDLNGNNQRIRIAAGAQVTLYLTQDMEFGGSAGLEHDCDPYNQNCDNFQPANFQIYGGDGDPINNGDINDKGGYTSNNVNNGLTERICLSGDSTADAFILAPEAEVGVNGTGNGDGFRGTVWAENWSEGGNCGSSTDQVAITQAGNWQNLPIRLPRRIDSPTSWQQRTPPDN